MAIKYVVWIEIEEIVVDNLGREHRYQEGTIPDFGRTATLDTQEEALALAMALNDYASEALNVRDDH